MHSALSPYKQAMRAVHAADGMVEKIDVTICGILIVTCNF
jgi:hypothetical protein